MSLTGCPIYAVLCYIYAESLVKLQGRVVLKSDEIEMKECVYLEWMINVNLDMDAEISLMESIYHVKRYYLSKLRLNLIIFII